MKRSGGLKDLSSRFMAHSISSAILAALLIMAALPAWYALFAALIAIIAMVALYEYYDLLKEKGLFPAKLLGLVFCAVFIFFQLVDFPSQIILGAALLSFFLFFGFGKKDPLINVATSFFGLIYIATPFSLIMGIILLFEGSLSSFWLAYLVLVTKSCDMGGYFFGRVFGKHTLAAKLSPNKTIEGAIGGLLFSCVAAIFLAIFQHYVIDKMDFSVLVSALLGVVMGIFAGLGDLAESLFKRDANVKDSSKIPAIGGVLDVVDSLLFTAPVLFIFLKNYS